MLHATGQDRSGSVPRVIGLVFSESSAWLLKRWSLAGTNRNVT